MPACADGVPGDVPLRPEGRGGLEAGWLYKPHARYPYGFEDGV